MRKSLYTISENSLIASKTFKMVLEGEGFEEGEFVDIGIPGYFLRRPLSVCDWEEGRLTLVYKVVGEGTDSGRDSIRRRAGSGRCWLAADWGSPPCSCWPSG